MDLKLFFSPAGKETSSGIKSKTALLKYLHVFQDEMPEIKEANIALIGITESRGSANNDGVIRAPDNIRKVLYNLKKGFGNYRIVDLGNLRNGMSFEETNGRVREVCQFLIQNNVLPVLFGGTHAIDYGQYQAYDGLEKLVTVLNVDAFLDMEDPDGKEPDLDHTNRIFLHEPNYLFHYSHLAYQSYLVNRDTLSVLEKLYFETHRLGNLHTNLVEMEPVIRNADMLTFDISAIKSNDAPGSSQAQPFGLTGEEACQICWYAGLNEKLSSAGFYQYNPDKDDADNKTAKVVATMIWYFIEGYYHRQNEQNFKANDYMKYVVSMPADPETLIFYKSKASEKWWMEVPIPKSGGKYKRDYIIPCTYSDYEKSTSGDVPDRYISTLAKLV
jgi:formiminoglutamase